ncbi:c-type cytochrome [Kriegella aquimaris]|uniref:Cytochrome c n=1 Tax=Kriegella aquimaris TaxID=192904 RepID=A0A1G9IQA2_9FLAO|nr:c-type cytochrome [Kriegella aquimaris]SDL27337.1 Cytochrome c [Kriegella aquimaris]
MKKKIFTPFVIALLVFCGSCSDDNLEEYVNIPESKEPNTAQPDQEVIEVDKLPEYEQRTGNPSVGYEYLISGDYMSSGIPYDAFLRGFGADNSNVLGRTGDNTAISYDYTAVNASNGVRVVAPNCLQCHAGKINDNLIVGLGNHAADFTMNRADEIGLLNTAISFLYGGQTSEEWLVYDQFRKSIVAIGPKTIMETIGVNPADKITQVLVAHRDKNTLEWNDEPYVTVDDEVIPTDVPAWWLLKKKNAMFYHAIGRADFCKSFIGSSLLTLSNSVKAEELDAKMVDVLAYINSLEPPQYPYEIDTNLSAQGKMIFETNCTSCHGTYGTDSTYPNFMVSLKTIGTDPELSNHYTTPSPVNNYFFDWFNTGWFGTDENPLEIVADGGYIAPPLDGVWATAPYFHNGSVPTLEDVLNSKQRPTIWSRSYDSADYDQNKLGWNYTIETSKTGKNTYDTSLKGYGNGGHTFGDDFNDTERKAILEYLKTL